MALAFLAVIFFEKAGNITHSSKDFSRFPRQIGEWKGEDLPLEESVYEVLRTRDVLLREYKDGEGNAIVLTVVYSENDRAAFHPPELCYLGGGVELLEKKIETVPLGGVGQIQTNTLEMKSKKNAFKAWYWFAARDSFTHNFYLQQATLLINWLRYQEKSGALIRVSAVLDLADPQKTEKLVYDFIAETLPFIKQFLKKA
jgi:EpsI family protein